jgi:hypothetical protein
MYQLALFKGRIRIALIAFVEINLKDYITMVDSSKKGHMKIKFVHVISAIVGILILVIVGFLLLSPLPSLEFPEDIPSTETLLSSAVLGGNYLVNVTYYNGNFIYEYDPMTNTQSNEYNILRHAGTIYSMLKLYEVTENNSLLSAAQRALRYLLFYEKPYGNGSAIVYEDEMKLGGNGLAILALVEHALITGDMSHLSSMQALAIYIQESQRESGEFLSKRYYSTGDESDFVSLYYPGEAMVGLCRLYELDRNETWLDIAEKGALYLINERKDIPTEDLVHDHWLVIALNELYRYRPKQDYFDHSMRLAEAIMMHQVDGVQKTAVKPEYIGSYIEPRSTPTATRSEALVAAFHLSYDYGDLEMTQRILDAITLGIIFQLQTQFTHDNMGDMPNQEKAIGGFHDRLTKFTIRIDYVQHNLCSILGLYHIILMYTNI